MLVYCVNEEFLTYLKTPFVIFFKSLSKYFIDYYFPIGSTYAYIIYFKGGIICLFNKNSKHYWIIDGLDAQFSIKQLRYTSERYYN